MNARTNGCSLETLALPSPAAGLRQRRHNFAGGQFHRQSSEAHMLRTVRRASMLWRGRTAGLWRLSNRCSVTVRCAVCSAQRTNSARTLRLEPSKRIAKASPYKTLDR